MFTNLMCILLMDDSPFSNQSRYFLPIVIILSFYGF